jgi:hypothetical protein
MNRISIVALFLTFFHTLSVKALSCFLHLKICPPVSRKHLHHGYENIYAVRQDDLEKMGYSCVIGLRILNK